MTAERDTPESWLPGRAREPYDMTGLSPKKQYNSNDASGVPATGSNSKSVKRQKDSNSSEKSPSDSQSNKPVPPGGYGKLPRWTKSWVLWTLLLAMVPGAIAFMATAMLLKLPSAPNCPSIFWPLASASVRLHCAQLAASKQTVKDLLQAIDLVKQLPPSHPLRAEIDRYMEEWSKDILDLADQNFQLGRLEEAISTARKVPKDVSAYKVVEEQVAKWQTIWSKAEEIYKESEAQLREQNWHQAFMLASKLLRVDNKYWSTTKYDELNRLIVSAREDGDKLAKAQGLAETGSVENILKAIKLTESIEKDSYVYQKAQATLTDFGRKILAIAQTKLDRRDADGAIALVQKVPAVTGLKLEVEDFIAIAEAQNSAWTGTVSGLETAISQAQQIDISRPVYEKAQKLIALWQLEIEDVARLEKARTLATQGTVSDLSAAIAEAQLIPASNPRAQEARQDIGRWVAQVQIIEDRPYLDRADQIALFDDVNSLQAAIAEANQVRRGRALYREARKKIATWTEKIQRTEDQPYLDRARALASSGDLPSAIETARQISVGRALSGEAQASIDEWQGQLRARENWKRARETALAGTPEALAEAIRIANRVPEGSSLWSDVSVAVDQWSQQLLDIARAQGESDMARGIETARLIPRGTSAYSAARDQIRAWEEFLNPPAPQTEPQVAPETAPTEQPTVEQPATTEGQ
ncbi:MULTISPECIES: type 2 periplasmic-binding domain-containing protein [Nostocales]|uniref:Chromosome segregation ATPase n=3 Tax=Nostocales TaxID=1161 RepID=A0A0C1QVU0_9CYAN|nr:chromosome segregation ATPase [Tolypothrix bouteillei]KAF3888599.1 chromosome segregation ATPase [Tolypothrix bouteillei VB521301]